MATGTMREPIRRPRFLILAVVLGLLAAPVAAQESGRGADGDALGRSTPRTAMLGYLEAARKGQWERAAEYLDLRLLPPALRDVPGAVLARKLKIVLDQKLWVDLEQLSDASEGDREDDLPTDRDLVGVVDTPKEPIPILLERGRGPEGRIWRISSATVVTIPALYAEFGYGRLGELLPPIFFELHFAEVQLWQWIGILVLVVFAAVASWIVAALVFRFAHLLVSRSDTTFDDRLLRLAAAPLRLTLGVLIFAATTRPLGLALPVHDFLAELEKALTIVAVTWLLLRVVDLLAQFIQERMIVRGQMLAMSVVPMGRRVIKVLVVSLAGLAALQSFGVNVTGILAGLGIGGLAVALAAQKTVENVFGGMTLIADQPVRVGDFCRFGDKIGTVEDVGLRSTRVRTLDRTVITIPNAEFSNMQLENFARRDRIWFHPKIGLRYETTPDQLRWVLIEIKKMLVGHPKVEKDPARVRFVGFGDFSLDLEIFAYVRTSDINEYLAVQEDLSLRIMDIVDASGTGFAFPSHTTYLASDTGLDEGKSRAAEGRVAEWRAQRSLGLPNFPPDRIAAMSDTLDYPPQGSALRGG